MVKDKDGPIDRLVGHSLGGGLASAAALVNHIPATTFNAAGVAPHSVEPYGGSLSDGTTLIDAYRVQGDLLSSIQNASGAYMLAGGLMAFGSMGLGVDAIFFGAAGFTMPDGVGKDYWLTPQASIFPARHSVDQVILSMKEMLKQ